MLKILKKFNSSKLISFISFFFSNEFFRIAETIEPTVLFDLL